MFFFAKCFFLLGVFWHSVMKVFAKCFLHLAKTFFAECQKNTRQRKFQIEFWSPKQIQVIKNYNLYFGHFFIW